MHCVIASVAESYAYGIGLSAATYQSSDVIRVIQHCAAIIGRGRREPAPTHTLTVDVHFIESETRYMERGPPDLLGLRGKLLAQITRAQTAVHILDIPFKRSLPAYPSASPSGLAHGSRAPLGHLAPGRIATSGADLDGPVITAVGCERLAGIRHKHRLVAVDAARIPHIALLPLKQFGRRGHKYAVGSLHDTRPVGSNDPA